MTTNDSPPLILFSGLAADAAVFTAQKAAFPNLLVPHWPIPSASDTLDSYSQRLAGDLRKLGRVVIGGASFGGIIALHVARYLDPLAVLLIGSIESPMQLPRHVRWARPLRSLLRFVPLRLLQLCCAPLTSRCGCRWFPYLSSLAGQFRRSDPVVFKWSLSRLLDWTTAPKVTCPVFHIHGDRDRILPLRYTTSNTIVKGGGHVISLSHPAEVNDFIRSSLNILHARSEPHHDSQSTNRSSIHGSLRQARSSCDPRLSDG